MGLRRSSPPVPRHREVRRQHARRSRHRRAGSQRDLNIAAPGGVALRGRRPRPSPGEWRARPGEIRSSRSRETVITGYCHWGLRGLVGTGATSPRSGDASSPHTGLLRTVRRTTMSFHGSAKTRRDTASRGETTRIEVALQAKVLLSAQILSGSACPFGASALHVRSRPEVRHDRLPLHTIARICIIRILWSGCRSNCTLRGHVVASWVAARGMSRDGLGSAE